MTIVLGSGVSRFSEPGSGRRILAKLGAIFFFEATGLIRASLGLQSGDWSFYISRSAKWLAEDILPYLDQ
jgi:hypothetical protein